MPTAPAQSLQANYQIKVTLLGSKPPIWRRLLVSSGMNLAQLHDVIQLAMGWYDSHLHEFTIEGERFGPPDPFGGDMGEPPPLSEKATKLSAVLGWKGAKGRYTYDFGDGWEHQIVVEKILPPDPEVECPVCTAGKLRCPPEDCGGLHGYYNLLEAIADPGNEEHDHLLEWLGGPFDPEEFSIEETNTRLARLRKKKTASRKAASSKGQAD